MIRLDGPPVRLGARRLACVLVMAVAACSHEAPGASPPTGSPAGGAVEHPANVVEADRFDPVSTSPCGTADGDGVEVYFTCEVGDGPPVTAAVVRPGSSPTDALDALFAGPTPEETAAGFRSGFGEATRELAYNYARRGDVGVVDLSPAFLEVEFLFVPVSTFAELVSTVGGFDGVERVAVLVDGRPLCVVLEEC